MSKYSDINVTPVNTPHTGSAGEQPPEGALARFSDDTYEYTSNGTTTNEQVMESIIHQEVASGQHPELAPMDGDPQAARMACVLEGEDPDAVSPSKTVDLKHLLGLIEPFLKAWSQNHAAMEEADNGGVNNSGGWGQARVTIGLINNDGISIPFSEPVPRKPNNG